MSLPKFFFPQAAIGGDFKSAEPYWNDENYVAQEKLDGARYILHKAMDGTVRAYSRRISKKTGEPVDKTAQLIHLVREFDNIAPPGTVIDGEVCAPGLSFFNLVTRVTGSKPDRAKEIQERVGYLVYHAFDCLAIEGEVLTEKPFFERFVDLTELVIPALPKYIDVLEIAVGESAKRDLYNEVVKRGGEGIILKDMREKYHQGQRHKAFVKVKKQRTFDVVFMGIELANETSVKKGESVETTTRIAGKAGAIKYGQYVEGPSTVRQFWGDRFSLFQDAVVERGEPVLKQLGTCAGFDDATRDYITENAESLVGRVFEVTGQAQFPTGAIQNPRFVQWRDDKRAEDCFFRENEG